MKSDLPRHRILCTGNEKNIGPSRSSLACFPFYKQGCTIRPSWGAAKHQQEGDKISIEDYFPRIGTHSEKKDPECLQPSSLNELSCSVPVDVIVNKGPDKVIFTHLSKLQHFISDIYCVA